jgi:type I restriction enzyme M protein
MKDQQRYKKRKDPTGIAKETQAGLKQQQQLLDLLTQHESDVLFTGRKAFEKHLQTLFKASDANPESLTLDAALKKALLDAFGEKDPNAEICRDKGNPEPDVDLRDTENVPLPDTISLPLPLDYESRDNKGKVDKTALLAEVKSHCEAYLAREVLPMRG